MNAHNVRNSHKLALAITILLPTASAWADFTHGPDPYAPGFGFDRPHEATWGGWTRGSVGTLWAEWDNFRDASHGATNDRTAAPDVGSFGASSPFLGWSMGTFQAGSGNLYSFTQPQRYTASLTGAVGAAPATRAVLQIETWGNALDGAVTLNGFAPNHRSVTYTRPDYPSSFGPVLLEQLRFIWDLPQTGLPSAADTYLFSFATTVPHQSLAQVAVDIAPVPIPPALALLGSALAGLGVVGRRKAEVKSET